MVDVVTASLQKKTGEIAALAAADDSARLRLATLAARVVTFDWTQCDDRIVWDGAVDILPYHLDSERMKRGQVFLDWLSLEGRAALLAVTDNNSSQPTFFELELEVASAMGALCLTMAGMRVPGVGGRTERLVGLLRETTERQ